MLQPTLLGLALLLVGLGYYYYHYLPAREEAQTERLFRHLNEMSDQLAQKIDNLTNCLHSASAAALKGSESLQGGVPAQARQAFRTGVEAFVPGLTVAPSFRIDADTNAAPKRSITLRLERLASPGSLTCDLAWGTNDLLLTGQVSTELGGLVAAIISRHEFQDLLLVTTDGQVLNQPGREIPHLERLPRLQALSGRGLSPSATNRIDLAELITSTRATADLAGRRYVFFLEPLTLPVAVSSAATGTHRWLLAGVIEERELDSRARPLPYFLVFGFAAAVLLLAILLPFLNIVTEGSRKPIHNQQVVFLVCATLVATCGLVIVSSHVAQHWHQETLLDRKLNGLAADIERSFHQEMTRTVDWLGGLKTGVLQAPFLNQTNRVTLFGDLWSKNGADRLPRLAPPPAGLRMVQWIQTNGDQAVKWSVTTNMTPLIRVKDRDYFQSILTGQSYPANRTTADYGVAHRFFLQPIYSRLRSENVLACSIAAPVTELAGQTNLAVVCAEFQPASLMGTLLPAGFHFAVVASDGQVLFHSDTRRNLRENLLTETDDHPRLRAALEGRGTDTLVVDYYQRRHRIRISPLPGVPWMLVVMREHRLLDSMRASQATATLTLLFAAGLAVMLGLWAATGVIKIASRRAPGLPRWLWPNEACIGAYRVSYRVSALILLGAVTLELTQFSLARHGAVFALLVLLGPAWVIASCIRLAALTHRRPEGRKTLVTRSHQRDYVSWLAITLATLVIPGALALHRVIAEIEAERFVRWTQAGLGDALWASATNESDPTELVKTPRLGDYRSVFQDTQCSWSSSEDAVPGDRRASDSFFGPLVHAMRKDFKDPDDAGVKMHGWGHDDAADHSWWSSSSGDRLEFFSRRWHPKAGLATLKVSSETLTFPTLDGSDHWVVVSLLGILLGLLAVWLAATFIASRVLLLRHAVTGGAPLPSFLVAVAEPPLTEVQSEPLASTQALRSFVASQKSRTRWRSHSSPDPEPSIPGSIQIWDHREHREPPDRETLARWLEFATDDDGQVVVLVSSADAARSLRQHHAMLAGTWILPEQGDITGTVLGALAREYERRWNVCSPEERRVLWKVARTGFEDAANPVIAGLLENGLLRLDPKLRIPGASWRAFILATALVDPLPDNSDLAPSGWPVIRTMLVVAALGIMAFLMLTQPDTWQRTTGVIAGLLAGFKLMGDFLGAVRKESTGGAGGKS